MKKVLLLCLLLVVSFTLNAGDIFMVPKVNTSNDKVPSMCTNNKGDTLLLYRNGYTGVMYYLRKSGSTTWIGPNQVPGQDGSLFVVNNVNKTEVATTADGKFHAIWCASSNLGIWYATFDSSSQTWSSVTKVVSGTIEDARVRVNPINNDVVMVWIYYIYGTKDVYMQNLTTGTRYVVSSEGGSETNPDLNFDTEGYLYVTFKKDRLPFTGTDEFIICLTLFDPSYNLVWKDELTWFYYGWRFMPTVAVLNKQGICAWASSKTYMYEYTEFTRSGNTITFDDQGVKDLVPLNTVPWFHFFSRAIAHGDKIYWFYMDPTMALKMKRYQNGAWLDSTPVDISNGVGVNWPFFISSCTQGIWVTWFTRNEPYDSYFTLFEAPLVLPATNVQHTHLIGGSLYTRYYMDLVTWEDNPDNVANEITVSKFRIYHRDTSVANSSWVYDGEVTSDVLQFAVKDVPAADVYEYGVASVDENGNESSPANLSPSVSTPNKDERIIE